MQFLSEWCNLSAGVKFLYSYWIALAFMLFLFGMSVVVTVVTSAFYNAKLQAYVKFGCQQKRKTHEESRKEGQ